MQYCKPYGFDWLTRNDWLVNNIYTGVILDHLFYYLSAGIFLYTVCYRMAGVVSF